MPKPQVPAVPPADGTSAVPFAELRDTLVEKGKAVGIEVVLVGPAGTSARHLRHFDFSDFGGGVLHDGDSVDMTNSVTEESVSGIVASDDKGQYVLSDADGSVVYLDDEWEAIRTFDAERDA